jgi:hypothetical protein
MRLEYLEQYVRHKRTRKRHIGSMHMMESDAALASQTLLITRTPESWTRISHQLSSRRCRAQVVVAADAAH